MPHVDDGTLHALLDGALRAHEPDRADRVEAHLDACADCRARLEEAAALRDRASDVLGSLDAGLAPEGATAAAAGAGEPVPDFQDVLARASDGQSDEQPEAGPESGGVAGPVAGGTVRAGGIRRRYQWTRGLAWAATIVVALGTGYLVRDLAGPTGVVPSASTARSALEQVAPESADEPDAAPVAAAADETEADGPGAETSAARQEAAAARAVSGEGAGVEAVSGESAGAGAQPGEVAKAVPEAGGRRADIEAPTEERELMAADALASAAAADVAEDEAGALVTGAAGESQWRAASLEEAEARAGAVLQLPTGSIMSVELGVDGSVRTRQLLAEGVEIEVFQVVAETTARETLDAAQAEDQVARQRAEAPVAEAMAPTAAVPSLLGLDLDSVAATVAAPLTVRVARDGYVLTLTGMLPEDVLRALAATAAPRKP